MNLYFLSNFDCKLKCGEHSKQIFQNVPQKVFFDGKGEYVEVYPTQNGNLQSYFFNIENLDNEIAINHNCVKVFKVTESSYYVFLQQNQTLVCPKILCKLNNSLGEYQVVFDGQIKILCDKRLLLCVNSKTNNADIYEKNNYVFVEIDNSLTKHFVVFNQNNNIVINEKITSVEHTENGFQTLFVRSGIINHGIVKKYEFANLTVEKVNQYNVFVGDNKINVFSPKTNFIAFFDAFCLNNYKIAKQFCTNDLSKKINKQNMKQYIGKYDEFIDSSTIFNEPVVSLINFETNTLINIKVSIKNDLVDNIEII